VGIADRLGDAEYLWAAGRREGALMSALIAFAAPPDSVTLRSLQTALRSRRCIASV
jgi:hypothetical protein